MSAKGAKPTAISLFSGAGGLDVGFTRAGYDVVFSNEMDADAAAAYCSNPSYLDPAVMHVGDVKGYLGELAAYKSATDLVFGGPPCQGFSVAGKMDPGDTRSELVFTFMDVVESVRPRLFVMENVKALASLKRWESVRERLFDRADDLGYGHMLIVLNASEYGVPQARERMFFIGARGMGSEEVEAIIAEQLQAAKAVPQTTREVLASLPPFGSEGNPATCTAEVRLAKHPILRKSAYDGSLLFNGRGRPMNLDSVAKTLPAQMGGNHTPIVNQALLDDEAARDWIAEYHRGLFAGELVPEEVEVPSSLRRLTVREAAALQTFPSDYVFCGKPGKQYRQVGNAVPCRLAETVACATLEGLLPRISE